MAIFEMPNQNAGIHAAGALFRFRLYVAGETNKTIIAIGNLRRLCDVYLPGRHDIEVIDLVLNPGRAIEDQIIATPTLVRRLPEPLKRVIGDLSDTQRVLVRLDMQPNIKLI
jgi:circadian clock protein KaiB